MAGNRSRRVGAGLIVLALAACVLVPAHEARADDDLFGGIGDIVGGVFDIPVDTLVGTFTGPPIVGTVAGVLHGTIRALSSTTRGVFRLLGAGIPLAFRAAPYVFFFL